ncbi:hypothetical protein AZE42_07678 [Rhizopogon vesiculosus]|uniref:Uncharacterized protein n=1 Tax=Rhizopogon vesiculosus TaxID=180088 RepID=A0A1J8QI75_9AGAM|nr:hypothetical protein AZE42_07678 [Rhizopogon vesiculosus]
METKNTSLTAEHSLLYLASHDLEHAKKYGIELPFAEDNTPQDATGFLRDSKGTITIEDRGGLSHVTVRLHTKLLGATRTFNGILAQRPGGDPIMPTPGREGTLYWRGRLPEGANDCWYQEYRQLYRQEDRQENWKGRIVLEFYTETRITAVVSSPDDHNTGSPGAGVWATVPVVPQFE